MSVRLAVLLAWVFVPTVLRFSAARAADAAAEQAARAAAEQAAKQGAAVQLQQRIEATALAYERHFQTPLRAELELVRRSAGSLSPEARKAIVAAGNQAVKAAAKQFATGQLGDGRGKPFDVRASIQEVVTAAIRQHASPDEFAAYQRECAARLERRAGTARTLIVAKLDRELELSAAQREAIAADLAKGWQATWIKELDDNGNFRINNYPPAPDFAAACITPHLDARQKAEWQQWASQAGSSHLGHSTNWGFDNRHVLQPDPWWTP